MIVCQTQAFVYRCFLVLSVSASFFLSIYLLLLLLLKLTQNNAETPQQKKNPQQFQNPETKVLLIGTQPDGWLIGKVAEWTAISSAQEENDAVSADKTKTIFTDVTAITNPGVKDKGVAK